MLLLQTYGLFRLINIATFMPLPKEVPISDFYCIQISRDNLYWIESSPIRLARPLRSMLSLCVTEFQLPLNMKRTKLARSNSSSVPTSFKFSTSTGCSNTWKIWKKRNQLIYRERFVWCKFILSKVAYGTFLCCLIHFYCTDMSKKSKDMLRDSAL